MDTRHVYTYPKNSQNYEEIIMQSFLLINAFFTKIFSLR